MPSLRIRGTTRSPTHRTAPQPAAGTPGHPAGPGTTPDGWTEETLTMEGHSVFYRRGPEADGVPLVHVHSFAISGSHLLSRALIAILDGLGIEKAVLIGNSMGCPISLEIAHAAPERVHRLALVSPAGGIDNQPLRRALGQLAKDGARENPRMARVAVPDYVHFGPINALSLFSELMRFPSLERLVRTPVPALAVPGNRDPLMPPRTGSGRSGSSSRTTSRSPSSRVRPTRSTSATPTNWRT